MMLGQIWGPILVALGAGIFISPDCYRKVYRNLENETLAVMLGGLAILAVGIAQTLYHNVWGTLPEIFISLLGWAAILKGLMLLVYPRLAERFGDKVANTNFFKVAAAVCIILGAYVSYLAYLS